MLPHHLPAYQTRADKFDEYVEFAMERMAVLVGDQVGGIEFAVEEAPVVADLNGGVPLGRLIPATKTTPPRVVIFRRPIELRAHDKADLHDLVFDVVVEQIAHYLGRRPDEIDPEYEETW